MVVSVGGDGTVLYCARLVQNLGIPILAVNLGTFGYITEIGCHEWKSVFEDIFGDRERLSRRLMLRVSVIRKGMCRGCWTWWQSICKDYQISKKRVWEL